MADEKNRTLRKGGESREVQTTRVQEDGERGLATRDWFGSDPASPFSLMRRLAEDMDRAFGSIGSAWPGFGLARSFAGAPLSRERGFWSPQVEMFRRGDELVVRADLPGMRKEDVQIRTEQDRLIIEGERRQEQTDEREGFYHTERSYGRFTRMLPLPEGADPEKASATFRDGVLEITMPAPAQQTSGRRIEIK